MEFLKQINVKHYTLIYMSSRLFCLFVSLFVSLGVLFVFIQFMYFKEGEADLNEVLWSE